MSDLAKPPSAALEDLKARAVYYGQSTLADKTKKTYATEYGHFRRWAESRGLQAMPPDVATVAVYLAALADGNVEVHWEDRFGHKYISKKPYKYGSIQRNYISIIHEVRAAGYEWPQGGIPAITKVLHGIKYRKGDTKRRMAPLEVADLRACLAATRERRFEDLTVLRDRAMLSLGFFAALRSAELVAIQVEDLDFTREGLTILIRKSKTDQFGEGVVLGIRAQGDKAICPVALLRRYLDVSEIKTGPIFRRIDSRSDCYGDKALTKWVVARIVKAHAEKAGLDPERFASHSLRAGFVTTAAAKGVPLHQIMRQTRHKDQRVAMTYIRPATVWNNNPTEGIGDEEPKK